MCENGRIQRLYRLRQYVRNQKTNGWLLMILQDHI